VSTEKITPASGVRTIVLTPKELADLLKVTEEHLERMRAKRQGPKWIYLGRLVRYRSIDVQVWLEENPTTAPKACKQDA
jgi:predicted DNA-binding transcriptional regulator AlpA